MRTRTKRVAKAHMNTEEKAATAITKRGFAGGMFINFPKPRPSGDSKGINTRRENTRRSCESLPLPSVRIKNHGEGFGNPARSCV